MWILLFPLGYMAVIWGLSSLPGGSFHMPGLEWLESPKLHNLLHIPLFGGLAYTWMISLSRLDYSRPRVLATLLTVGYGVLDEGHQFFVPGRYASALDAALNGIGTGLALWWVWWRARRHARAQPRFQASNTSSCETTLEVAAQPELDHSGLPIVRIRP